MAAVRCVSSALQPAQALSRELGIKGEWPRLRYELALYQIDLDDELLAFSLPAQPGRNFYRNAGESRRQGLELSLDWQFAEAWRWSVAYAYNRYHFQQYRTALNDFSGQRVPGIPPQTFYSELAYERAGGYVRVGVNALSGFYANDANSVAVPGYAVFNLRVGKRFAFAEQSLEPYLGVDNLLGREYFDNVRSNDANARYFEPGPGRTLYAGLRLLF